MLGRGYATQRGRRAALLHRDTLGRKLRVEELEAENRALRARVKELEAENAKLKAQLGGGAKPKKGRKAA